MTYPNKPATACPDAVAEPRLWRHTRRNAPTQPVVGVTYWEAEAFCRWAGGRLPAERDREAAARGPDGLEYPWGNTWEDGLCNSAETRLERTSPAGVFPRSRSRAFGLEDMAGNVWEWCADLYGAGAGFPEARVLRGGSWGYPARDCRAAVRDGDLPDGSNHGIGFRVCVSRQNSL
jgi:formylglycine-generating enzyme required for sulfatase activity